ncbi:hypothetical protein HUW62_21210, partial [Myxococcus sp. AM011]|uniref:hypothetical protein n=1 Tax=Myxococcus sp. AM011 TaxID=2745200 RepID=UPI0015950A37
MSSSSSERITAEAALSRVADDSREEAESRVEVSRDDSREATGSRTGASRVVTASRGGGSRVARGLSRVVGSRVGVAVSREVVVVPRVGGGGSRDGGGVRVSRVAVLGGGTSEGRSAVRAAIESSEALFVGGGALV